MQWELFLSTGTLVRMEAIITELVFEHALRIRMKAQIASNRLASRDASAASTPDSRRIIDTCEQTESTVIGRGPSANGSEYETLRPNSRASIDYGELDEGNRKNDASSFSGPNTPNKKAEVQPDTPDSTDNLVGKLNNLVTTDLANIVEGRDFMLLGQ